MEDEEKSKTKETQRMEEMSVAYTRSTSYRRRSIKGGNQKGRTSDRGARRTTATVSHEREQGDERRRRLKRTGRKRSVSSLREVKIVANAIQIARWTHGHGSEIEDDLVVQEDSLIQTILEETAFRVWQNELFVRKFLQSLEGNKL
ncbi:hypothetical protein ALC53_05224 [Atta colombica]|uniref:Uncharacterized protein n=1 Tax=Atta colombica TaxID=520822 RepID=A0A195BHV5_9HYME|nr:hypothetical protein ALC53_05224 [Atta colombica]